MGAPVWATTFEHARSHRVEEAGEWLLAHPLMAEHMENNSATSLRQANVLFLYGKYCWESKAHYLDYHTNDGDRKAGLWQDYPCDCCN